MPADPDPLEEHELVQIGLQVTLTLETDRLVDLLPDHFPVVGVQSGILPVHEPLGLVRSLHPEHVVRVAALPKPHVLGPVSLRDYPCPRKHVLGKDLPDSLRLAVIRPLQEVGTCLAVDAVDEPALPLLSVPACVGLPPPDGAQEVPPHLHHQAVSLLPFAVAVVTSQLEGMPLVVPSADIPEELVEAVERVLACLALLLGLVSCKPVGPAVKQQQDLALADGVVFEDGPCPEGPSLGTSSAVPREVCGGGRGRDDPLGEAVVNAVVVVPHTIRDQPIKTR